MQYIEIIKGFAAFFRKMAALSLAAVMTLLSVLTLSIDALSADKRHPEVSKDNVLLIGAAERSQGITTDGEYFYFSSKWGLTKSELDGTTRVCSNPLAIPDELEEKYGLAHIGGISYCEADNCIYAGVEDSKVWIIRQLLCMMRTRSNIRADIMCSITHCTPEDCRGLLWIMKTDCLFLLTTQRKQTNSYSMTSRII